MQDRKNGITDSQGGTDFVVVSIMVDANGAAVAVDDSVSTNTGVSVAVLINDSDPEGRPLLIQQAIADQTPIASTGFALGGEYRLVQRGKYSVSVKGAMLRWLSDIES